MNHFTITRSLDAPVDLVGRSSAIPEPLPAVGLTCVWSARERPTAPDSSGS